MFAVMTMIDYCCAAETEYPSEPSLISEEQCLLLLFFHFFFLLFLLPFLCLTTVKSSECQVCSSQLIRLSSVFQANQYLIKGT